MDKYCRSGNVDLAKFLAAIMIIVYHMPQVNVAEHSMGGWIFVEFFLIITGYFSTKHFDGIRYTNRIKESLVYTVKKFVPYLPYTVLATVLVYIWELLPDLLSGEAGIKSILVYFSKDFLFEIMLIMESYGNSNVIPLWYLSALLLVFPLFSLLIQITNRYGILLLSLSYALVYYGICGVNGDRTHPNDLFRVFAGLCLGAVIFETLYIFKYYVVKINKVLLTIIEGMTYFAAILFTVKDYSTRFVLLCFVVCLSIMLSNLSYSNRIRGKVVAYLGKVSLPIYAFHWFIGLLVAYFSNMFGWDNSYRIILYLGGTLAISALVMYWVDHWTWFRNAIQKPLILHD